MSGIFGIFNRNGNEVVEKTVNTMLDGMSYWEPDERNTWINGPVVLGHTMLWNTPESKYEHLPVAHDTCILTMDARIDNRDELLKELELPSRSLKEIGDSEFILAAYKKWGEESPKYLLGDFAFAIWDGQKRQLFCARDHVGVKQFYYYVTDDLFVFGNDLKGLMFHPNISKNINDQAVANYIVNFELVSQTLTFFEKVKKLPPANSLIITSEKINKTCYWKLEDTQKIKLDNVETYAKKLRKLLEQAVYDRLRSDYPITSHLSGGLDSSSIAVIAARKLSEKDESLLAFNWLHEPTAEDDSTLGEWSKSKIIAEAEGIEHHYTNLNVDDIYNYIKDDNILYGHHSKFWYEFPIRVSAQQKGSRTILSGWGGDELASYYGQSYLANLFFKGSWKKLFQELKFFTPYEKRKSVKSIIKIIYHYILVSMVPTGMYCKMPKIKCYKRPSFAFIRKSFLPSLKKEKKKLFMFTPQPQRTIRKHMLIDWNYGYIQSRIQSWATAATSNRLEYSYPLLDKRIIEFIVGIPADCFVHEGKGRYIFRSAAAGLLPENILWTDKQGEPNRVKRLISLASTAYKVSASSKKFLQTTTKYVDNKKLRQKLEKLNYSDMSDDDLMTFVEIEASLALIMSL